MPEDPNLNVTVTQIWTHTWCVSIVDLGQRRQSRCLPSSHMLFPLDRFTLHFVQSKGSQIIRNSRSHLKIVVARRVTCSKLQTEDTNTSRHGELAAAPVTVPELLTASLNEKIIAA